MTYLAFLAAFVLTPTLALLGNLRPKQQEWKLIGWMVLLAYVWTTAWDNYLVATGVWSYDPRLVLGIVLGWVPLEEYLFFGIMTGMSAAWVLGLKRWTEVRKNRNSLTRWLAVGAAVILGLELLGLHREPLAAGARPGTYLFLILIWAGPVILLQLCLGARYLLKEWPLWVLGSLVPTLYLTAADCMPLRAGTWLIDPQQSLNLFLPGRVPLEEGVFFLVTNVMIVQGLLLAAHPEMQARAARLWLAARGKKANRRPQGLG